MDIATLLNELIISAIMHGGDSGGAYFSNYSDLYTAMLNCLSLLGDEYTIKDVYIDEFLTEVPQFVRNSQNGSLTTPPQTIDNF